MDGFTRISNLASNQQALSAQNTEIPLPVLCVGGQQNQPAGLKQHKAKQQPRTGKAQGQDLP
jgi:hypothetical protein